MMKLVMLGTTALFLTASSIANAQSAQTSQTSSSATPERLSAADQKTLTDLRIDLVKHALQKFRKQWVGGPTKAALNSCAIVTPSPFCNDARKHWRNDQPIWINSPRPGNHSTRRLVPNRGSAWVPSRSLYFTT